MFAWEIKSVRVTLLKSLQSFNARFLYFNNNNKSIFLKYDNEVNRLEGGEEVKVKIICDECVYILNSEIQNLNMINGIFSIQFKDSAKTFNRRRFQRISLEKDITILTRRESYKGRTIDISEGGAAFHSKELFSSTEPIFLSFWSQNERKVCKVKAEIRNMFILEDKIKYGVEFMELSKRDYNILLNYLKEERKTKRLKAM